MTENEKREAANDDDIYNLSLPIESNIASVEREIEAHDARDAAVFAFLASVEVR